MPRFIVDETQAVWATWTYEIEAPSKEEAIAFARSGEEQSETCSFIKTEGPFTGDSLNNSEPQFWAEELGPEECL
jgi:hypothetical protein